MVQCHSTSPLYHMILYACPALVFTCITSYGEGISVSWRINLKLLNLLTANNFQLFHGFNIGIININNTTSTITSTATNVSVTSELNGTIIDCSGNGVHYNTLTVHTAGKIHHEPYVS